MIEKKGKKNLEGFLCGQAVWMYVRLPSPVSTCLTSIADMPRDNLARVNGNNKNTVCFSHGN